MSSTTRHLIARLRERLGHAHPQAPADIAQAIPAPPRRIFPIADARSEFATLAAKHTTALLGIGHVGSRYATDVALQFQAELAVAHEAVATQLPQGWAAKEGLMPLQSRVHSHREYLLRPDLGRRLSTASLELLSTQATKDIDVQLILADGLSASACMQSGVSMLHELENTCQQVGLSTGSRLCVQYARVWIQDEIGAALRAKVAIIILGERPGLGTGDGLSAYLVHAPAVGNTDSQRNMISNIHARGTPIPAAALRLAQIARAMLEQERSGVTLDLAQLPVFKATATSAERQPLVEVNS